MVLIPEAAPGKLACGSAPPDWRVSAVDDAAFADRVLVPDAGTGCARTQLLRWRFTMGKAAPRVVLTLRARYQHGFVAYLDGTEVARRRLLPDAALDALATQVHGPEWERIALPAGALGPGDEHLLAIEVHPRTAGREPSLDVELAASDGPRIVHGPYLASVTTRAAIVAFETDVPTQATLEFGAGNAIDQHGKEAGDAAPSRRHVFMLGPLRTAAGYHYRITARGGASATPAVTDLIAFHTPPERGQPLRFVIYGDVRSGHDVHAELVRQLLAEDPDLAIMTGDLVDMGSDEADWDRYFEIANPLLGSVPVYPSPGNHEYARGGHGAERFRVLFGSTDPKAPAWHSFDVAGVHFVALDSNQYRAPAQLAWLRADLEHARGARAIIAYAHEGAYSSGPHGDNETARTLYAPLLEAMGATLYVSGHDHHYERGRVGKLEYIVSGGGGAELRAQRCGVPGRKACPPRVAAFANEHHYILVEILPGLMRLCPKRPDGTPLEACTTRVLR